MKSSGKLPESGYGPIKTVQEKKPKVGFFYDKPDNKSTPESSLLPLYDQVNLMRHIDLWVEKIEGHFRGKKPSSPLSHSLVAMCEAIKHRKGKLGLADGYCHALSLRWLSSMQAGKETSFYNEIKRIVDCPKEKMLFKNNLIILKNLVSYLEWANYSEVYTSEEYKGVADKILTSPALVDPDVASEFVFADPLTAAEKHAHIIDQTKIIGKVLGCDIDNVICPLEQFLRPLFFLNENDSANGLFGIISSKYKVSEEEEGHSIGIYCRNKNLFIYDANNLNGEAKSFSPSELKLFYEELLNALYPSSIISKYRETINHLTISVSTTPAFMQKIRDTFTSTNEEKKEESSESLRISSNPATHRFLIPYK